MDERQAIARLKRGDLRGLEALVRGYQVQAVHSAYLIVGDRAQAEDVVQAAFLAAADKIAGFDSRRPFGPWFLRSVVNASLKAARRQKRLVSLDAEQETFVPEAWLLDPQPGPEEQAIASETRRMVWQALERLTPEQRAVVVLRHFLDLSEHETARELGQPLTTVKWRLHAARERLKKLLHALRPPEEVLPDGESREQEQVP